MSELLTELFSSRMRAAVLEHVIPRSQEGHSLTELHRALGLSISSLQHECYKLERIGVLSSQREGTSRRYRVNQNSEIWRELTALVAAGMGQDEALRATLETVPGLSFAFLGSELPLPTAEERGDRRVPLVLIGELPLEVIDALQERVAMLLGISADEIEVVFYLPEDWNDRIAQGSVYPNALISGPRTDLFAAPVAS